MVMNVQRRAVGSWGQHVGFKIRAIRIGRGAREDPLPEQRTPVEDPAWIDRVHACLRQMKNTFNIPVE